MGLFSPSKPKCYPKRRMPTVEESTMFTQLCIRLAQEGGVTLNPKFLKVKSDIYKCSEFPTTTCIILTP